MRCPRCDNEVEASATACSFCGGALDDRAAETLVSGTGSATDDAPRAGAVLAERYELEERIGADALTVRFRAIDQESERTVLVTVVVSSLLSSERERAAALAELAGSVGVGGRYLPGLLAAERERNFIFTVEPWPAGTPFRLVMTARASKEKRFSSAEVLPVVAQLVAALDSLAPGLTHGDVRLERVWIDAEGLTLTGPFVVPALPKEAVAAAVSSDTRLRAVLAPETRRGTTHGSADRYGIAAIALEALTGATPGRELGGLPLPAAVADALEIALADDASKRLATLAPLVGALATSASVPVPELDPAPFRRVRRGGDSGRPPPPPGVTELSEEASDLRDTRPQGLFRHSIARAIAERREDPRHAGEPIGPSETLTETTAKRPMDELLLERDGAARASPDDTAPHATMAKTPSEPPDDTVPVEALAPDPTSPRAAPEEALAQGGDTDPSTKAPSEPPEGETQPRAVIPVARRVEGAAAEGTQEIRFEDLEEQEPADSRRKTIEMKPEAFAAVAGRARLDPSAVRHALFEAFDDAPGQSPALVAGHVPRKSVEQTQELGAAEIEEVAPKPKPKQKQKPVEGHVEIPAGIKPIPKPRRPSLPGVHLPAGPTLFDDSAKTTPLGPTKRSTPTGSAIVQPMEPSVADSRGAPSAHTVPSAPPPSGRVGGPPPAAPPPAAAPPAAPPPAAPPAAAAQPNAQPSPPGAAARASTPPGAARPPAPIAPAIQPLRPSVPPRAAPPTDPAVPTATISGERAAVHGRTWGLWIIFIAVVLSAMIIAGGLVVRHLLSQNSARPTPIEQSLSP